MRILFFGAGVLGSLYAARLQEAGHQVSVLARGQRLKDIQEHGIVLEEAATGKLSTTKVNAVDRLDPKDSYDLAVVLVRKDQLASVLPVLAANESIPSFLFMGNNPSGPEEMIMALGRKRVLLGFPGAGGYREGYVIYFRVVSAKKQPTTFGELDGSTTDRLKQIVEAFRSAGFPVEISRNMDSWLKTHVALVSPTANALYLAGLDNYRLAKTRDGLVLMIRAIREGFRVLRRLGIPITPSKLNVMRWMPEPLLVAVMKRMLNSKTTEIEMVRHAKAGRDEMKRIADDFRELASKTTIHTQAMDKLYLYLDPAHPPLPSGSAQIPLSWSGVWIGLVSLLGLSLILVLFL